MNKKESLDGLLNLLSLFLTDGGIKHDENLFHSYMRLKDYGMAAYSCLESIIDTYGKEPEMNIDEIEKRIEKLETLVTGLCVVNRGTNDEERALYTHFRHITNNHAYKFVKTELLKQKYSSLKEELKIIEEDYPELKDEQ